MVDANTYVLIELFVVRLNPTVASNPKVVGFSDGGFMRPLNIKLYPVRLVVLGGRSMDIFKGDNETVL